MFRLTIFFILNMASICTWAQSETIDSSAVPPTQKEELKIENPEHEQVVDLFAVEQQPEFPNGTATMYQWLGQNIKYPEIARQNNIEGSVILNFIIEKDGSISNINAVRGVGGGCTEEAIRAVKMMPNWIPGKQNGQLVRVKYVLPIMFKLTGKKGKKRGG